MTTETQPADIERRLRRAGLPLLVEDPSPFHDVFTRAVPLMALVFCVEVLGAIDLDWAWWANVLAAIGGLVIALAAVGLANRRHRRPVFGVPERVGRTELATFVVVPTVLPVIFGLQWVSGVVTGCGNLLLLGTIYLVIGMRIVPILRWALLRLAGELATSLRLLSRAVPVLFIVMIVLFVNTEMWQVGSDIEDPALAGVIGLFALLGSLFIGVRLPREVVDLEREAGGAQPLSRRQRINVEFVMFISQGLQVLVVALLVFGFFIAFGMLAITPGVAESWIGHRPAPIAGQRALSIELIKVSAILGSFAGLYYVIAVLNDESYREEFLAGFQTSLRETLEARTELLRTRGSAS